MGIKPSEYAIHRGVSKPAVSKAIKLGRITLLPDGTIDPDLADKQWAGSVSRVNTPKQADKPKKDRVAEVVVVDSDVTPDAIAELAIPDGLPLTEIKAIHETIKARHSYLNLVKERGELTDVALVNKQLFTIGRDIRDGWLNWVNQVSGDMAAELQVDQHKLTILLERKVKAHLSELSESDFQIKLQ